MLNTKIFEVIWTSAWVLCSSDVCGVISAPCAFKLTAVIFNALINSDKILIMRASGFNVLIFNDLSTDLRFESMLNVYLRSRRFMSSLFSSSANLTAWFLITRLRSEAQRRYCLSMLFTYLIKTSSLPLFMNLSRLSFISNDLRLTCE